MRRRLQVVMTARADPQLAAVSGGDRVDQREAGAGARARRVVPPEALGSVGQELWAHAGPVVVHGEHCSPLLLVRRQRDVTRAVSDGVVDRVAERPLEQLLGIHLSVCS